MSAVSWSIPAIPRAVPPPRAGPPGEAFLVAARPRAARSRAAPRRVRLARGGVLVARAGAAEVPVADSGEASVIFSEKFPLRRCQTVEGKAWARVEAEPDADGKCKIVIGCDVEGKWLLHWGVSYHGETGSSLGGVMKRVKGEATSQGSAPPAAAAAVVGRGAAAPHASASQAAERLVATPPERSAIAPSEAQVTPAPTAPARRAGAPETLAEQAIVAVPGRQLARPRPKVLEAASAALRQLRPDLKDGDGCAMGGHLGLISGWLSAEESVRATWSQASATVAKDQEEVASAVRARDAAQAKAASFEKHCREVDDDLKALREEDAKRALELKRLEEELKAQKAETSRLQQEQLTDRVSLEKLKAEAEQAKATQARRDSELKAKEDALAASEKAATVGREALAAFELEARTALQAAYEEGFEEPLATPEDGAAGLLVVLVKALHEVAAAIGQLADTEGRVLLTSALARVCGHLYLRNPNLDLATLSEPVAASMEDADAKALEEKVKELVEAFLQVPAAEAEGAEAGGDALGDA